MKRINGDNAEMTHDDRFRTSTLLPSDRDILEESELWHSNRFHITCNEGQIFVHYRNYPRMMLYGTLTLLIMVIWIIILVIFTPTWLGSVIITIAFSIGIAINIFPLFSSSYLQHPLIIDIEQETISSHAQCLEFEEVKNMTLLQTASDFMSGGKHYFNLVLTGDNSDQKLQLFEAYFNSASIFNQFGILLHQIFELHGLAIALNPKEMKFTNNFEHFPLID